MSTAVLRSDPTQLSTTLKEAVVDALLNMTHAQVSGAGEFGEVLYGARPRSVLNSAFLLPAKKRQGDDEVTAPIWISSHGLDMQLNAGTEGVISVRPSFSVYVRILPTSEDLQRDDCRLQPRLNQEVAKERRAKFREALNLRWEKEKELGHVSKWKHPLWEEIQKEVHRQVCASMGLPDDLRALSDLSDDEHDETASDDIVTEGLVLSGSAAIRLQDDLFQPLNIPHKWRRLDVDVPELVLVLPMDDASRNTALETHAAAMKSAVHLRINQWLQSDDEKTGGKRWALPKAFTITPSQYRDWSTFLKGVQASSLPRAVPEGIDLRWSVDVAPDWLRTGVLNVHLALENRTAEPSQRKNETEEAVFLVRLDVTVTAKAHHPLRLERVEPSYRYNRYLEYPAIGHNGGVEVVRGSTEELQLRTTWAPRYVLPRIVPLDYPGIERGIRALAHEDGLQRVNGIVRALEIWLEDLPKRVAPAKGIDPADSDAVRAEHTRFTHDLRAWQKEIDSIKAGVDLLTEARAHWQKRGVQSDPRAIPFEAWLAMNESMADMMYARLGTDDAKWHLFQLAFVLASINAPATRLKEYRDRYAAERDDTVTLLYFATGGGKSEAFFGLLVYTLFLDRLRGKHMGITAMLRYPLRLLTIQQAQRAAKVLAFAEMVRAKYDYVGDHFAIGFWVGSGGSPNRHNSRGVSDVPAAEPQVPTEAQEAKLRQDDAKYDIACKAWNKIPQCPFCKAPTALRRFTGKDHGGTLAHVCTNAKCFSHGGGYRPLNFYICDDDIYDRAPAVLLGTVDKLALIGHSGATIRRIFGMFGLAPWRHKLSGRLYIPSRSDELRNGPEASGYEALRPVYQLGKLIFFDPFPSLIIQDEAHLLDESLGTFAGLFESTLDAAFETLSGELGELLARDVNGRRRRAKVIAASATVSEPQRQLEHLYQRLVPAMQFPHPGPTLHESFYATPQEPDDSEKDRVALPVEDVEVRSRQARVYVAFMMNGRPHTATSVATLSGFHLIITRLFKGLTSSDASVRIAVRDQMLRFLSDGPLRDQFAQRLLHASDGDLATLIDLHRIALTYVTNKKGGDQILAAENEETRKRHKNEGIELLGIDTRLITGSVDQGEIQKVVELVQKRVKPGHEFEPIENVVRSVVATSAISHGVDVEELNSMFFAGMPSDIAEYIQASSRVGRTHVGFCLLIPTPQRRRDRYIVEVFDVFHRFLERMVTPAAIDRWADKAIERCFPSILQTYLCAVRPYCGWLTSVDADKFKVPRNDSIDEVLRQNQSSSGGVISGLCNFAERAIGLLEGYSPEGELHYRQILAAKAEEIIGNLWTSAMMKEGTLQAFFNYQRDPMLRPMTSLRDVDQGGVIQMAPKDGRGKWQNAAAVLSVMSVVRHGVAEGDGDDE